MESVNLFDLIIEKIKDYKGHTVVELDEEDGAKIFHYDTKEEFEKDFRIFFHQMYRSYGVVPKTITKEYGSSVDCIVEDEEEYLDINRLYYFVDGKIEK